MAAVVDRKMKTINVFLFSIAMFSYLEPSICSLDAAYCTLNKNSNGETEVKLLSRLAPLYGERFQVLKDKLTYDITICTDVDKTHANTSVLQGSTVFGRRNDTSIIGEVSWVLLTFGSGDQSNTTQLQCASRSASVLIVCDPTAAEHSEQSHKMKLLPSSGPCACHFLLSSAQICQDNDSLSGFAIFLIVACVLLAAYFAVGIAYKRIVYNSQGCQQLPHFPFWSKFGALCSDGCSYLCKCDERESDWNTITSNLDPQDRDDALLRP